MKRLLAHSQAGRLVTQAKNMSVPDQADPIADLIAHASTLTANTPSRSSMERVKRFASAFNKTISSDSSINIFLYHVDMGEASRLSYRDISMDTAANDYGSIIDTFLDCARYWLPESTIYIITSPGSALRIFAAPRVHIVELDVDYSQPMYERVSAMCAYVHSVAFSTDTLFLDSDAFLNADITPYLDSYTDVIVTARDVPGLMSVNEGVIMARHERPQSVAAFFLRYLATYEKLINDPRTNDFYGDIRKWRGGQLSLNAITWNSAPFSPYRTINSLGTRIRVLPCDLFNYSHDYQAGMCEEEIQHRLIVHLKGSRKDLIGAFRAYFTKRKQQNSHLLPRFAIINKMYYEPPFDSNSRRTTFAGHLTECATITSANVPYSGSLLADDQYVWFRNLGFLTQSDFVDAFAPYREDGILLARIWRIYLLCWAARSCMQLAGDFVDLGCYDGRTVDVITRYIQFQNSDKQYYLYDLFDNPTPESRKSAHGPDLFNAVCTMFANKPNIRVIAGEVPNSFSQGLPDSIAFAQIDLNEANAEIAALEILFDRIVSGGILILDDYGFQRYAESHARETAFFADRGHFVFESPTGQGLVIKRN